MPFLLLQQSVLIGRVKHFVEFFISYSKELIRNSDIMPSLAIIGCFAFCEKVNNACFLEEFIQLACPICICWTKIIIFWKKWGSFQLLKSTKKQHSLLFGSRKEHKCVNIFGGENVISSKKWKWNSISISIQSSKRIFKSSENTQFRYEKAEQNSVNLLKIGLNFDIQPKVRKEFLNLLRIYSISIWKSRTEFCKSAETSD